MPEGDTLFRIAATLNPVLSGQRVVRFASPVEEVARAVVHAPLEGQRITSVAALGKNLLIHFEDGRTLHIHLRMHGALHLYRPGERWKGPLRDVRAEVHVEGAVAVCFRAPVVRLIREGGFRYRASLAQLGPDYLAEGFDAALASRNLQACGARPLGDVFLEQRAAAGVGNVYKSEVLFLRRLDPFAPVSAFTGEELALAVEEAKRLLERNVAATRALCEGASPFHAAPDPFGPSRRTTRVRGDGQRLWVYRRDGLPCFECGAEIRMRRQGELARSTYFCAVCQPSRVATPSSDRRRT